MEAVSNGGLGRSGHHSPLALYDAETDTFRVDNSSSEPEKIVEECVAQQFLEFTKEFLKKGVLAFEPFI